MAAKVKSFITEGHRAIFSRALDYYLDDMSMETVMTLFSPLPSAVRSSTMPGQAGLRVLRLTVHSDAKSLPVNPDPG